MKKNPIFTGANVAIITPFDESGINFEEFGKIIDHQIENGTDAITLVGTTGEGSTLSDKEHREAIAFGVERVNGRVPVIAGTGSNDTSYAVELCKFAAAEGVDGLLTVTPYYNKTTQAGLVKHFSMLADATDKPIILYNVPSRTGVSIAPTTYAELAKHPNVNGAKEASGNLSTIAESMALCGENLNFWSGNDDQIVPIMALGGKGVISVLSNVAPSVAHKIAASALAGDFKTAAELQLKYLDLINSLFIEVNPIPVKAAMALLGWKVGGLRMPLCEISPEHLEVLKKSMQNAGLL
jgi:4-hydroxy-tetrahydrodipicolinate synthase